MKFYSSEIAKCVEDAAIAVYPLIGSGENSKNDIDAAATKAIQKRLNTINIKGTVVSSEGLKDDAPMLELSKQVGAGWLNQSRSHVMYDTPAPYLDVISDVIEGTTYTSRSQPGGFSILGVAESDSVFSPNSYYVNKLAYSKIVKDGLDCQGLLSMSIKDCCDYITRILNRLPTVHILDRARNLSFIEKFRALGCKVMTFEHGDVMAALSSCLESPYNILYGIGGGPESVITAAAMKTLGGGFEMIEDKKLYHQDQIIRGECCISVCGVTGNHLIPGISLGDNGYTTHTLILRSASKTKRWIKTEHGN